jgi:hypothetical protein
MNVAKWKDVWSRFSGRGTYPHELAVMLLFPLRRMVFSPETLVRHLHLTRVSRGFLASFRRQAKNDG